MTLEPLLLKSIDRGILIEFLADGVIPQGIPRDKLSTSSTEWLKTMLVNLAQGFLLSRDRYWQVLAFPNRVTKPTEIYSGLSHTQNYYPTLPGVSYSSHWNLYDTGKNNLTNSKFYYEKQKTMG